MRGGLLMICPSCSIQLRAQLAVIVGDITQIRAGRRRHPLSNDLLRKRSTLLQCDDHGLGPSKSR
jgi:hypothetical protein